MDKLTRVTIRTKDPQKLRKLVGENHLDTNCGGPQLVDGEWVLEAYIKRDKVDGLKAAGISLGLDERFEHTLASRQAEVGRGNRFVGSQIAPQGVGKKE